MKNLVIRKKIASFSNKTVDEFLQRAVKASGSLKNNVFNQYVSELSKSAKEFHEQRKVLSTAAYTEKIHKACKEADEAFRKLRMQVEYSALCLTGQEQSSAKEILPVISLYGNIANTGVRRKFADYDAFITDLKKVQKSVSALKLDGYINTILQLTPQYRDGISERDVYRSDIKGRRCAAREKAENDYFTLRDSVEAYARLHGQTEVAEFVKIVNEALIYLGMKTNVKKTE
jgi:hypothetical protein